MTVVKKKFINNKFGFEHWRVLCKQQFSKYVTIYFHRKLRIIYKLSFQPDYLRRTSYSIVVIITIIIHEQNLVHYKV